MWFSKKTWKETRRYYTPPRDIKLVKNMTEDTFMKVIYGFTTIELRCNETGELKHYTEYGNLLKGK